MTREAVPPEVRRRRLRRLGVIARLMDTAVRLPGTRFSFGLDSIVGLIPAAGDAATAIVSFYILYEAWRLRLPGHKLGLIAGNIALDTIIGAVPLLGDVFDAVYKANLRNIMIIEKHFEEEDRLERVRDITPRRR